MDHFAYCDLLVDEIEACAVDFERADPSAACGKSPGVARRSYNGGQFIGTSMADSVPHVTPGAFASGLTLLVGLPEVIVALVKAGLFGLAAGLIACYKGISVGGGPAGVGNAVNETVVYAFMALFVINVIVTAVGVKATM